MTAAAVWADSHTGGMSVTTTVGTQWRWLSSGIAAVTLLAACAGSGGSSTGSSSAANCNGVQLNAAFLSGGPYDQIFTNIPVREKQTGATVTVAIKGAGGDFFPSVLQALATGSPQLD